MDNRSTKRVYILDPLRFIAALGVVLYHLSYRMPTVDHIGGPSFPEIDGWTRYLHLGVELFFMISGFVIAFSVQGKSALQFAWSRFVRLYPAYWLCVIITFSICHYFWRPHYDVTVWEGVINLTMFQSIVRVPNVDLPYWTLAEELRFYAMIFVLLALKQGHRLLTFVSVWMALCFIDLFKHVPFAHYEFTLEHAPFFAAGVVYYDAFKNGFRLQHWILSGATFALGCIRFLEWSRLDALAKGAYCSPTVIMIFMVCLHLLFILIALDKVSVRKSYRWLGIAGGITYPLYLIHNRLGSTAMVALSPVIGRWNALMLTCLGACVVAYAIWRWWELPFGAWIRRRWGAYFADRPREVALSEVDDRR